MSAHRSPPLPDDLPAIAAEQRRENMAAKALDSDLNFAFNLQLQEVISASLDIHPKPSSSSAADPPPFPIISNDGVPIITDLFDDEILKLELELKDQKISELEFRRLKDDLHRRIHDHQVAMEISTMPEDEWEDWGNNFERPFGEGSSKGVNSEIFRVYFKGLVERESPNGALLGGIGVAICDSRDGLLFELQKPLMSKGPNRQYAELQALIEALNSALELELKRVVFLCDHYPIFKFVSGQWSPKQKKISALVKQVIHMKNKFTYCQPLLVPRNDIKFAFKLARETIDSQLHKAADSSGSSIAHERCVICFEERDISQIFSVDDCQHRYCLSCMKQHVEVKLLHGMLPMCPQEECQTKLKIDSCSKFLTARFLEIMSQHMKEASIPVTEKIYCPFPKCSALMSKNEVLQHSKIAIVGAERSGARKCIKCNGRFCINCKVPWHNNMTCFDYKRKNPYPQMEEAKLKNLAATNLWRQCVKCNHMIELATGCYHMTCRCGYEFCYTCGAEWKNKKATCMCPLWNENYIIEDDDEFDEDDEDEDEGYFTSDFDEW